MSANIIHVKECSSSSNLHPTKRNSAVQMIREEKIDVTAKMVFSIIGDSDNFVPKPWRKTVFQSALIDAAQNAGESWILVRGGKGSVKKIVSDAFYDYFCREFFDTKGKSLKSYEENQYPDPSIHIIELAQKNGEVTAKERAFVHKPHSYPKKKKVRHSNCFQKSKSGDGEEVIKKVKYKYLYNEFTLEDKAPPQDLKDIKAPAFDHPYVECKLSKMEGPFFNFEKSKESKKPQELSMRIPVILIVVEGDLKTIKYIESAVRGNIPILLVKGSGKAADLIVKCMQDPENFKTAVIEMSPLLFGISFSRENLNKLFASIKVLLDSQIRHLINVFDVDNDDPLMLSKIIGEAIVRTWAMENADEEHSSRDDYAMNGTGTTLSESIYGQDHGIGNDPPPPAEYKTNREGVRNTPDTRSPVVYIGVREHITMKNREYVKPFEQRQHVLDTKFLSPASLPLYFYFGYQLLQRKHLLQDEQGSVLLLEALKSNRRDYVQVLLDQNVTINDTFLYELYVSTVNCDCSEDEDCLHISWILKQFHNIENEEDDIVKNAQKLVRKLLGYKESKGETEYEVLQEKNAKKRGCCCFSPQQRNENENIELTISDLLLWSIFANRPDLSQILWLATDNHLMTGLVCTALLKKIAKKASNVKEEVLSRSLNEHAKLFSDRCLAMLSEMYDQDAKAAMKIVDSKVRIWGILSTPITFAYENYEMDFIAHTCPQRRLNRIWYNKRAPDLWPFLGTFFKHPRKFAKAPFTRFIINYVLFLLMIVAFSALVMTSIDDNFYKRSIARVWEYYIYVWAAGDFIEEIRNGMGIFTTGGKSHRGYRSRAKRYLNDFWNAMDLLSYILLILAMLTRHLWESHPYTLARRMFAVSLLSMYLRILQMFLMNRILGPTLIMIKEMLKDLSYFLLLALVAIIGVGIYYHANLYPNHINLIGPGTWDTWHIWKILYYPYWQLYGESFSEFLEVQEQSNCTSDPSVYEVSADLDRCAEKDPTVPIVSGIYMLISNLLLVNLVIAMFSYTFDTVMANSEKLWRFQRYTVITDYEGKVPSPINFIIRPIQLYRFVSKKCKCKTESDNVKRMNKLESKFKFRLRFQKMIALRISSSNETT